MFIEQFPGAVPVELCELIVERFERDPGIAPSRVVVGGAQVVKKIRSGTQLSLNGSEEWRAVHAALVPALQTTMKAYASKYRGLAALAATDKLECSLPLIERVMPGQGFDWHADQSARQSERVVAGLLYLRSVSAGGRTEFWDQETAIVPEAGKIVLFPPFWTHYHRGAPLEEGAKYVLSFFWRFHRGD